MPFELQGDSTKTTIYSPACYLLLWCRNWHSSQQANLQHAAHARVNTGPTTEGLQGAIWSLTEDGILAPPNH